MARNLRLSLLVCLGASPGLALAQTAREKPHVLPEVDVNANVPLVKVGEFHMLEARVKTAAVAIGDFIYVIGGFNEGNRTIKTVERINLRTGVAEKFARLPFGRFGHRAVLLGEKIYVLGGVAEGLPRHGPLDDASTSGGGGGGSNGGLSIDQALAMADEMAGPLEPVSSTTILDPATGKITSGPQMPDARSDFGCVVRGKEIYVIGGLRQRAETRGVVNTVEIFDSTTGRWLAGAPMPRPGTTVATLVDGGFILVPGGIGGHGRFTEVAVFNPIKNFWTEIAPLGERVVPGALVFLDHSLFLFGQNDILAYDLVTKSSESFTLGYRPVVDATAVARDGKIYVIGGANFGVPQDTIQIFALPPKKT